MNNNFTRKLVYSALCLALCMILPIFTGQLKQMGNALCPMHLPVLLCGFLCGPWYGLAVGAAAPLLRSIIFCMPALFPNAAAMCFELAVYGFISGYAYKIFPKRIAGTYAALICAMLTGRIVWGIVMSVFMGISGTAFTMEAFAAGAFFNAIPGIILQIAVIPPAVAALEKSGLALNLSEGR